MITSTVVLSRRDLGNAGTQPSAARSPPWWAPWAGILVNLLLLLPLLLRHAAAVRARAEVRMRTEDGGRVRRRGVPPEQASLLAGSNPGFKDEYCASYVLDNFERVFIPNGKQEANQVM